LGLAQSIIIAQRKYPDAPMFGFTGCAENYLVVLSERMVHPCPQVAGRPCTRHNHTPDGKQRVIFIALFRQLECSNKMMVNSPGFLKPLKLKC